MIPGTFAPSALPSADFHSVFLSSSSAVLWTAGVAKPLFRFDLGGICVPGVRLYVNETDPQDTAMGMNGNDYTNVLENVASAGSQFATAVNLDTLGYYSASGWNCNYPLPPLGTGVASLQAQALSNCELKLTWSTTESYSISAFDVLYSSTGSDYVMVATIDGEDAAKNYSFIDKSAVAGPAFYIVRTRYKNGSQELTAAVEVANKCNQSAYANVYPNPASDLVHVDLFTQNTASTDVAIVELFDVTGRVIELKEVELKSGRASTEFDVKKLATGTYMVKYHNLKGQFTGSVKFLKN
jgi:hypothetical protein